MTEFWFYHLEISTLEQVLPELLEKTLSRHWRAYVKVSPSALEEIDQHLWTFRDDAFLPHGREDEPLSDQQPVLIGCSDEIPNGIDCVFLIDGEISEIPPTITRFITMVDGRREDSVARMRVFWKTLKNKGADISYWRQSETGQWQKAA